ncbi:hypothetical protein GUJ93_ZPchr0014g47160 [Zizania palustris]|uniref:Uncharacterized protein n=1 Tax=Zizania palustris TaxID=103762 RepID=A0A8J5VRQ3_ZIZPA|nr:hypothetical protein GUJ93_ZPchr0014g47274 [Zizania palustris]KAG8081935.1 hypothetical protein GUJ93_ZPchr0014g47160 [Zizania palustris]
MQWKPNATSVCIVAELCACGPRDAWILALATGKRKQTFLLPAEKLLVDSRAVEKQLAEKQLPLQGFCAHGRKENPWRWRVP